MRLIGTLPDEAHATRLGDYFTAQSVPNHVEQGNDGSYQLWIEKDDDLEKGQAEYVAFRSNPTDSRYDGASTIARKLKKEKDAKATRLRRQHVDVRTQYASGISRPTFTIALIVVTVAIWLITMLNMQRPDQPAAALTQWLLFQPPDTAQRMLDAKASSFSVMFSSIYSGQVWRLITPIFIHFTLIHILFNMYMLYLFGGIIESRRGTGKLVALVIGAAIFSNVLHSLWTVVSPFEIEHYSMFGGMSGVNYALFGYAWMLGRYRSYLGVGVSQQLIGLNIAWLFICMTGMVGSVANGGHVGGLIAGVVTGAWPQIVGWIRKRMPTKSS